MKRRRSLPGPQLNHLIMDRLIDEGRLVLKLRNVEWAVSVIAHKQQDMPSPTPAHCY
jgi:hypothetical protein